MTSVSYGSGAAPRLARLDLPADVMSAMLHDNAARILS